MRGDVKQSGHVVVCFCLALLSSVADASSSEEKVVAEVREIYTQANQLVEKNKTEVVTLQSEAGKDGYEIKKWHLVDDKQSYETGAYEVMVFILNRKVLKTRVVVQSLSGDWADVIEYYYHQNREPAFIFEGTTTYNGYVIRNNEKVEPDGPFILEKRSYFSKDKKRVRFLKKAYLKKTGEPVPLTQIQEINLDEFGSVCSLPFISLIQDKVSGCTK